MAKQNNQTLTFNGNLTFANPTDIPFSITISGHDNIEVFKISNNGEIYYKHNDEMIKVNCPDELSQAFQECVLQMTGSNYEDVMIEKYIQKILNHERSSGYRPALQEIP